MSDAKNEAVIVLLATDALEAANHQAPIASILLIDAALSILVSCHSGTAARRELAAILSTYVVEQVDAVIRVGDAA